MKKFLCSLATLFTCIFVLTSRAECVSVETTSVQVRVVDSFYLPMHTTYVISGKVLVPIIHSPTYRITVEYNGTEYNFYGSDIYNKYSGRIGEYINGTVEIKKYDNGSTRYNIIGLDEFGE